MSQSSEFRDEPLRLVQGETDKDAADRLRQQLSEQLRVVCQTLAEARAAGLEMNFHLALDSFGRHQVQSVTVVKPL